MRRGGLREAHPLEKMEELWTRPTTCWMVWNAEGRGRGAVYPQGRMEHFLDVIGSMVGQCVQRSCACLISGRALLNRPLEPAEQY